MMSYPHLPPEILDHTVDFLHDDSEALKGCCLVSKSWIPRARKHLFADVRFPIGRTLESWKKTFPDPSTSPARYTKMLFIGCLHIVKAADAEAGGWITSFRHLERLGVSSRSTVLCLPDSEDISLVPLHGLSPTVKYLCANFIFLPSAHIFDLILSFPQLEDLDLTASGTSLEERNEFGDGPSTIVQPSSSPTLTGSLVLSLNRGMRPITRRLLSLPGGINFRELDLTWFEEEDVLLTMGLVEECSHALESLDISCELIGTPVRIVESAFAPITHFSP